MNRTTISMALALSVLLIACGNKGDLYLETDQAITDEIEQLDESLEQLGEQSSADSEAELAKKIRKKNSESSQSN